MYNGIGLTTPRGSGTNGHVQRNWAFVRPKEKDKTYRTEEELCKLDTASNRPPNKEILDHERKRKIELKCAEFSEILEDQGFSEEAIRNKVNNYRIMLMGHDGKLDRPIGHWARVAVTETHHLAEAQKEKNARLREAFGISEYFVDGSSFDPDREVKEQVARSVAIQEKEQQLALERELQRDQEKMQTTRYELVHTPSPEPPPLDVKKKKKRKTKDSSSSDEKKRKKSKKRKKERLTKSKEKKKKSKNKHSGNSSDSEDLNSSQSDNSDSDDDRRKKKKLKKKEKKKASKKKRSSSESSHERSPDHPPKLNDSEKLSSKQKNSSRDKEVQKFNIDQERKRNYERYDHNKNRSNSPKYSRNRKGQLHKSRSRTPDQKKYSKSYREHHHLQANHVQEEGSQRLKSPNYRNYKHERYRSRSPISNNNHKQNSPSNDYRQRSGPNNDLDHRNSKYSKYDNKRNNSVEDKQKSFNDKQQSPNVRRKSPEVRRSPEFRRRDTPEPRKSSYERADYQSPQRKRNSYEKRDHDRYCRRSRSKPKSSTDRSKKHSERKRNESIPRSPEHLSKNEERRPNSSQNGRSPETLMETPPRLETQKGGYSNHSPESQNLSQIKTPPRELQKIDLRRCGDRSPKRKSRQQMPVVRLRSSSEDEKSDDDNENVDEEREKELRMLRLLKSGLAAKAKETLERKIPKLRQEKTHRNVKPITEKVPHLKAQETKCIIEPDSFDIRILPLKPIDSCEKSGKEIREDDCNEFTLHKSETKSKKSSSSSRSRSRSHTKSNSESKIKKSKSRSSSRSSYRSSSSSSSHHTTSRSPSRAHSSRSRSRSSSRSTSSDSSRSRSPSIPRRHGSPSFLDRRRITSARKRPIPYHRPTPSSPSTASSYSSSPWYNRNHSSSRSNSASSTSRSGTRSPIPSP